MYAASIDTIAVYQGYGQPDERPTGVPEDWTLQTERGTAVYATYEEAAAESTVIGDRHLAMGDYPHGWSIPENPDGTYGPVSVSYWAPRVIAGPGQSDIALATGLGSTVLCGVTVLALILV